MNTKTMEGLVGARTNVNMINTPLCVYKEARSKGDTATMERAMGYVNELESKAEHYKAEVDEGMKEDAKEAREKAELERKKAIEKRKEELEQLKERIEESRDVREDKVEISEDGRTLWEGNTGLDPVDLDHMFSAETKSDTADIVRDHVTYQKTGEIHQPEKDASISVSV